MAACRICGIKTNNPAFLCSRSCESRESPHSPSHFCQHAFIDSCVGQTAEDLFTEAEVAVDDKVKIEKLNAAIKRYPKVEYYEKRFDVQFRRTHFNDAMRDAKALIELQPTKGKVTIIAELIFCMLTITCFSPICFWRLCRRN